MPYIDAKITDKMSPEEVAAIIHDEEVIDDLIRNHEAIKDEAEAIREHANAIVRLLERSRQDIGRPLHDSV